MYWMYISSLWPETLRRRRHIVVLVVASVICSVWLSSPTLVIYYEYVTFSAARHAEALAGHAPAEGQIAATR